MIRFKKVTFRNFFSFGHRDTTLDLCNSPTTLITGDSGSGKSTLIVESITFCLFGKPFRKINKGDVVNSVNGKDCFISVEFEIGESQLVINRGVKPDIFEIYQDGVLINQNPNIRDYQKYLEEHILGMTHKTWISIVTLGFANHTPFMLLSAGARRQIVDEVLGIEIFQRMNEVAKQKVNELKTEATKLTNEIESIKNSIVLQKKSFKAVQEQEQEKEQEIQEDINSVLAKISEIESENESLEEAAKDISGADEAKDGLETKLSELSRVLTKLRYKRTQINQLMTFLEDNSECPTCKQSIDDEYKQHVADQEHARLKEVDNGVELLNKKIEEYEESINQLDKSINKINSIRLKKTVNLKSIKQYQEEVIRKQQELSKLSTSDSTLAKTIASTIVELSEKQKKLSSIKVEIHDELRHVVLCQGLLKEDGIKGKIIAMYLPLLTKMVNDFLEAMSFDMRITFDDSFNETIYARFRDKLTYTQLSQGEQSRVNLAIILAWRSLAELRNSVKVSILVVDELLDSVISAADTEAVLELVKNINTDQNIFIISHKPDIISPYFENIIYIEKRGNFSAIQ